MLALGTLYLFYLKALSKVRYVRILMNVFLENVCFLKKCECMDFCLFYKAGSRGRMKGIDFEVTFAS